MADPKPSRGAKPGNQLALKPEADRRTAPALYLRPTAAERAEIMRWAAGRKLAALCLRAVIAAARSAP